MIPPTVNFHELTEKGNNMLKVIKHPSNKKILSKITKKNLRKINKATKFFSKSSSIKKNYLFIIFIIIPIHLFNKVSPK